MGYASPQPSMRDEKDRRHRDSREHGTRLYIPHKLEQQESFIFTVLGKISMPAKDQKEHW